MSLLRRFVTAGALVMVSASSMAILQTQTPSAEPGLSPARSGAIWGDFRWLATDIGGQRFERAAMLVDVTFDGLPGRHQVQIDTGAHRNILHGGAVRDVSPAWLSGLGPDALVSGRIAGLPVKGVPFLLWRDYRAMLGAGRPMPVIATIGAPFLESRVMVIDYPRRRLGFFTEAAGLPEAIARAAQFVPIEYRDRKLYLPIEVAGAPLAGIFFDTGASAFPLLLSRADWERVTERKPDDPRNQRLMAPSWTKSYPFIGAPLVGTLRLGPAVRRAPMVYFSPDAEFGFDAVPNMRGLFGNVLFTDAFAVIVDLPRRRMGIITSAALARLQ